MSPPSLFARKFTFTHMSQPSEDASPVPVPVMDVTAQVLSFGRRSFWVHVAESRASGSAPPPPFGPSAVALCGVAPEESSEVITEESPQSAADTAHGLARQLARRLQKDCGGPVAVYVSCGITGEKAAMLLGKPSDSEFDVAMRFGAAVFRNVLELIREEILISLPSS